MDDVRKKLTDFLLSAKTDRDVEDYIQAFWLERAKALEREREAFSWPLEEGGEA